MTHEPADGVALGGDHDTTAKFPTAELSPAGESGAQLVSVPLSFLQMQLNESLQWRDFLKQELKEQRELNADREKGRQRKARRNFLFNVFFKSLVFVVPVLVSVLWTLFYLSKLQNWTFGPLPDIVGVVQISGKIGSDGLASADKVIPALEQAFAAKECRAIVLKINSGGGEPGESDRINSAVAALKAKYNKPVYAVIDGIGASAAYMIAMRADRVYAGRYSTVGSIGALMANLDLHRLMDKLNIGQRLYTSGPLKSMLNPFGPQSQAADQKAQALVSELGQTFLAELRSARGAHLKPNVDYGTGEVWTAAQAKDLGLIDEIATLEDVINKEFPGTTARRFGSARSGIPFLSAAAWESSAASIFEQVLGRLGSSSN